MSTLSSFATPLLLAYVACTAELLSSIAPHHKTAVTPLPAVLITKICQHTTFNVNDYAFEATDVKPPPCPCCVAFLAIIPICHRSLQSSRELPLPPSYYMRIKSCDFCQKTVRHPDHLSSTLTSNLFLQTGIVPEIQKHGACKRTCWYDAMHRNFAGKQSHRGRIPHFDFDDLKSRLHHHHSSLLAIVSSTLCS